MPLNHVALTVSDRVRSAAFYGEHFGLTECLHEDDHLLILGSDDGSVLALSQGKPIAGKLPRTNHFGFRLADEAAVRAARDRFPAAGVVETEWQDDGRLVRVQVADPDRHRVEVYAHCQRHDVEKRRPAPLTR
jgi:catechol 2,3-dioxygenase-like lactoylglutathione lyase family enzyme